VPTVHSGSGQAHSFEQEAPKRIVSGDDAEPATKTKGAVEPKLGVLPKPEITTELDDRQPQASDSPERVQRSGVPVSLVVILLMVTAAFVAIFAFAWSSDPGGGEDAQVVSVYVSGRANARDQPTAEGSSILATYDVGTELTGTWVSGASDASEQWLKFEVDGQTRYIWSRNLSDRPANSVLAENEFECLGAYSNVSFSEESGDGSGLFIRIVNSRQISWKYYEGGVSRGEVKVNEVSPGRITASVRYPDYPSQPPSSFVLTCSDGNVSVSGENIGDLSLRKLTSTEASDLDL
jgi:hypothetical protein